MIKVIVADKAHPNGMFHYIVPGYPIEARSREPLLDACRRLKALGVDVRQAVGLFRAGREDWDLRTTVAAGAALRVRDDDSTRFVRYTDPPARR